MAVPRTSTLNDGLLRIIYPVTAWGLRELPGRKWKKFTWDRLLRPYILWRSQNLIARTKFGARFDGALPDLIHANLYFFGVWEPSITAYLKDVLRPGDIVIDIGANVGAHALLAAHLVGRSGCVHAIEASPKIFKRLSGNITLNKMDNVVAYNIAVSNETGLTEMFLNDASNLGASTIVASVAGTRDTSTEGLIPMRRLDDIVPDADLLRARLIKIDVEGAEWSVLQGMQSVLPKLAGNVEILVEISCEALAAQNMQPADLLRLMSEAGFVAWDFETRQTGYSPGYERPDGRLARLARELQGTTDIVFRRAGA
jgi:FkbM family methyltransferase